MLNVKNVLRLLRRIDFVSEMARLDECILAAKRAQKVRCPSELGEKALLAAKKLGYKHPAVEENEEEKKRGEERLKRLSREQECLNGLWVLMGGRMPYDGESVKEYKKKYMAKAKRCLMPYNLLEFAKTMIFFMVMLLGVLIFLLADGVVADIGLLLAVLALCVRVIVRAGKAFIGEDEDENSVDFWTCGWEKHRIGCYKNESLLPESWLVLGAEIKEKLGGDIWIESCHYKVGGVRLEALSLLLVWVPGECYPDDDTLRYTLDYWLYT